MSRVRPRRESEERGAVGMKPAEGNTSLEGTPLFEEGPRPARTVRAGRCMSIGYGHRIAIAVPVRPTGSLPCAEAQVLARG